PLIPDSELTISSPASAASVIAVGSYTTKDQWLSFDGAAITRSENGIGEISSFSSVGPLRNGNNKPDIAAPGEFISAALSADALPQSFLENWIDQDRYQPDGTHIILRGTSMATPHVAGAVALLLQQNPNLSFAEIKQILIDNAIDRGAVGWDEAWGYGQLNVLGMLGVPHPPEGITVTSSDQSVEVRWGPNPESDISGYRIYYGNSVADVGNKTQHQLVDLPNGNAVEITVTAYNTRNRESAPSFPVLAVPHEGNEDLTPPLAPKNLVATLIGDQIHIAWLANREADLSHYELHVGASLNQLERIAEIKEQTTYQLEKLDNAGPIYLALTAVDSNGNPSALSEIRIVQSQSEATGPAFANQPGWPVQVAHNIRASAVPIDVNSDGFSEIVVGTEGGELYLLDHKGIPLDGWPQEELGTIVAAPAIGDLEGDGDLEIVVGAGKQLYVYASDGQVKSGWPKDVGGVILADVTLADLDADADLEIIATTHNGIVSVWHHDGVSAEGWPKEAFGEPLSSAAVGDLEGDGDIEIVVGGESIYIWGHDGEFMDLFGFRRAHETAYTSAPVLADLDGDGDLEIIAGSFQRRVEIWHHDGWRFGDWPTQMNWDSNSTPAIGDLDGDGMPEIVMTADTTGLVYAWHTDGSLLEGWPVTTLDAITASPLLADVNGDGTIEVILATSGEPNVLGMLYAWDARGQTIDGWPIPTLGLLDATPLLGDLDSDGDIEVVVGSRRYSARDETTDEIEVFGGFIHTFDLPFAYDPENVEWGMSHGDAAHTGRYGSLPSDVIAVGAKGTMPTQFARVKATGLFQNYPNPFNPETWIPYQLVADADVRITIYNASGQQIRTLKLGNQPAGLYLSQDKAAYWDGRNAGAEPVSSGLYFYQLKAEDFTATKRMVILK
ncbi:MAG: FG-GAP-like repeat-containing protein, partial [Candidatus Poribacteria bacterium]|nr:FG-GAP-like repeat-containing protein [Candidatus Poribacteria bacterium]